jgi:hypothetical protein
MGMGARLFIQTLRDSRQHRSALGAGTAAVIALAALVLRARRETLVVVDLRVSVTADAVRSVDGGSATRASSRGAFRCPETVRVRGPGSAVCRLV